MANSANSANFVDFISKIDVNFILIPLIILLGLRIINWNKRVKRMERFYNYKRYIDKNKKKIKIGKTAQVREKLYMILFVRNKAHLTNIIFNSYIILLFILFTSLLFTNNFILAVTIPIIVYLFINKIIDEMITGFDVVVRKNFTNLINSILKMFTTTNDLSIVLYESSKKVDEPLRTLILTLSREIMIDNSDQKLINFIEKTDNLWLHSFILTLLLYKENSSKENIIDNLIKLSDMIEKRNQMSDKMINDRKPIVIMNYMVLAVGIILFLGNLVLNPMMNEFIKSLTGNVSLIAGITAIFSTILINFKLVKY